MPEMPHLIIGTRGSDLALWQAHHVHGLITAQGGTAEIKVLSTQGDREQVQSFEKLEGKGFFTKEIEDALLQGLIDVAVHSHKDLETTQPPGLVVAAVPHRASARDVLLVRKDAETVAPWLPLRPGATVGTSSVRRRDQLLLLRPDVHIAALRGNVPTRIERLREGRYDAIILAEAGLDRLELNLEDLVRCPLQPQWFVPAPAQGALALQMREDDPRCSFIAALSAAEDLQNVAAERTVLRGLEGGCQLPFGAHWDADSKKLRCFLQTKAGPRRCLSASAEEALRQLSATATRTVLITRQPRPDSLLQRLSTSSGVALIEQPLVAAAPIPSPAIPNWTSAPNWVWLGSPGAVKAAEQWIDEHPEVRLAVPGTGTAEALTDAMLNRLDHIGQGHPNGAWSAFIDALTPSDRVAIPHSTASLKRWEEHPTSATLYPWAHYQPAPTSIQPPTADIVCFTSPSNVAAWTGPVPDKAVALGLATSAAMKARNWPHATAKTPDAFGILESILSC